MRRIAPGLLVLVLLVALVPPASAKVKGFRFSVAAGEVDAKSVRIWGATRGTGKLRAVVAADRGFRRIVKKKRIRSKKQNNKTVQTRIRGLRSNRKHFYRFCARGGSCSQKGQFTTAPKASRSKTIEFAYSGDTDGTPLPGESRPFFGRFEVFRAMKAERNDFNIHKGDTIYSDSGVGGVSPALTAKQKWGKYRQNLGERNLRSIRRSTGFYSHWDDHEFINDFSIPEDGEKLYRAGVRAFRDYAPVEYTDRDGIYRTHRWGKNLELFFLDERSFRSAKADVSGTCDNPGTGSSDLAPTAPPATRSVFAALIPSLANPVSQACKDAINDPSRTMLGKRQFKGFVKEVERSNARWKIIVNETPIMQFYGLPYDRWEGYAHERVRLLQELQKRGVGNLVFLTTDTHAAFANVVRERTLPDDVAPANVSGGAPPIDTPYQDFIIGPVATNPFWDEIDEVTGSAGNGKLLSEVFFKPDPPAGMGMACAQGSVNSYAELTVSKNQVGIEYNDETGQTVEDVNGKPCGPYTITPFAP